MPERPVRVYADTSVFGGVFDDQYERASRGFFEFVEAGRFQLVTSYLVQDEVTRAPGPVQDLFADVADMAELAEFLPEARELMRAYLDHEIVTAKWMTDAMHVALATVNRCEIIASWNFRHIVNFRRIPLYNAVNTLMGYGGLAIHSPMELIEYEKEV
jgi:predicted nucleic acid-binding protein